MIKIRNTAQKTIKNRSVAQATKKETLGNAVRIARDTALAQFRTAVILLRNTDNSAEQISNLKMHVQRLFDAPEELLWIDYITPSAEPVPFLPGKPIKARDQFLIIKKSLLLLGMEVDNLYVDNPEEKSWFLNWDRGKKARLFWTKDSSWEVTLYLAAGDGYACSGFVLDDFLSQIGIDRGWWDNKW